MRRSNRMVTNALVAVMTFAIGMQPLAAQGKGKGDDKRDDKGKDASRAAQTNAANPGKGNSRADQPAQPQRNANASRGDAQLNAQRKETRPDQRIERQIEHEFAGDVDLRGRGKGKGRFARQVVVSDLRPSIRRFFDMNRPTARAAAGAIARAHLRGLDDDALVIVPVDNRVRILNRANVLLVDLDDEHVRNLGRWDIIPMDDEVSEGAPAFCRS